MLAVASEEQAKAAISYLRELEHAGMSDVERQAAEAVIDLDADENRCPACLGTIPKAARMCPECGLRLG